MMIVYVSYRSSSEDGVLDDDHNNTPTFRRRKRKSKCDNTPPELSRATSKEKIEGDIIVLIMLVRNSNLTHFRSF